MILADGADPAPTLDALCACLSDDFDIEHLTFQLETVDASVPATSSTASDIDGPTPQCPASCARRPRTNC